MLKNYFMLAWRNLLKNKGFSAINIIGLAVGLATCLLILFYVHDELSYDRYNNNAHRIYRVDADIQFGGSRFVGAVTPDPMAATLKQQYPQVENAVRFRNYGGFFVRKGDQNIEEDRVIYADSSLFDVFTLPMISGNPKTALVDPHSVVITKSIAMKYFNRTDVVGESLLVGDSTNYKITGVIEDIPQQSHFHFDFFVTLSSDESRKGSWLSNNFNTYILLKPGTDEKVMESKLDDVVDQYVFPQAQAVIHASKGDLIKSGNYVRFSLTPLTDIHLYSNKVAELEPNSSIEYVYIFSAIAFLILLIACVNFINLFTARTSSRAKEVGVRKVIGSRRSNLIAQFLSESILITFISFVLALLIVALLLPYFNQLAGKQISLFSISLLWLVPSSLLLIFVVGLIAGFYPAFVLSGLRPITVLKGKIASGFKGNWLRSTLVVFQFASSIILLIGTFVIWNQLHYIRNKDLGYNRNQVLIIENTYPLGKQAKSFKDDMLKLPGVESATMTGYLPTGPYRSDNPFFTDAALSQDKAVSMQTWTVDENYIPTLDIKLLKGRNFSPQFLTDSNAIIINEAAAKQLGSTDPLNQTLYYLVDLQKKNVATYHIIGVIKDFNFNSLREQVTPMALGYGQQKGSIALRITTSDIPQLISQIQSEWTKMVPAQPFSYSFMDDDFNATYTSEQRTEKIFISFAILAIFIACLGLFGLAAYAAEQRTKEIGIRKVLGASVGNIINMLSRDFLKLVGIAALIAFPVAWYFMNQWLQGYAYRISIGYEVFLLAGLMAVLIALLTVSFQAIKTAIANPVKSLRTE